jgi:hypothetical protein
VTITAAVPADANRAIFMALSEQLDRHRARHDQRGRTRVARADGARGTFRAAFTADAHAIVCLSEADLRDCLLGLMDYAHRVDGEYYQPLELRQRLQVIARITPVLWDANCTAADVAAETTSQIVS